LEHAAQVEEEAAGVDPADDRWFGGTEAARDLASESAPAETPSESGPKLGEVVITEADPTRPKKGGWWQRAKAGFGGA